MKSIIAGLSLLFLVLQYQLWFAGGGLINAWQQEREVMEQKSRNDQFEASNAVLKDDIKNVKQDRETLEAHARSDLGMIKRDETFYQVVKKEHEGNS